MFNIPCNQIRIFLTHPYFIENNILRVREYFAFYLRPIRKQAVIQDDRYGSFYLFRG